jgi:hypothetical protein
MCAAGAEVHMYGCSYPGQRGNVLVLAQRDGSSSVKMGTQRIATRYAQEGDKQTWSWAGGNAVVLDADGVAHYFEGTDHTTPKGTFRCKPLGG